MLVLSQSSRESIKQGLLNVVSYYTKAERAGKGKWIAKCPIHKDDTPSMSVDEGKGTWFCFGCGKGGDAFTLRRLMANESFDDTAKWLGDFLHVTLVYDEASRVTPPPQKPEKPKPQPPPPPLPAATAPVPVSPAGIKKEPRKVAEHLYTDAAGELLYYIERWEPSRFGKSKEFVQRHANGLKGRSEKQVLYRLPTLATADTVFLVEGEKVADFMAGQGLVVTTWAGGTSQVMRGELWTADFASPLAGKRVILVPDNDDVGREAMGRIRKVVEPLAREVVTVNLPLKNKGDDAIEWFANEGGTKEKLLELVEEAAKPAPVATGFEGAPEWKTKLRMRGRNVIGSAMNLETIMENDEALVGLFAKNEFSQRVMMMRAPPWADPVKKYPRNLTDTDATRLKVWLEKEYGAVFPEAMLVVAVIAENKAFHPLQDELNSFQWDGIPRLDSWLQDYYGVEGTRFAKTVGRKWMISAVARVFKAGCQVDHVLVLEGEQGIAKSSAIRALAGDEWFLDHLPDFTSKDAAILLGRAWIHELAELSSVNRSEVEKVKQFVSQRVDVYRPPYGKETVEVPRSCVFVATTNKDDYLRDTTGNRRYWPVRCTEVDVEGLKRARAQLWAEALVAFRAGEKWHLEDAEVIEEAKAVQAERVERDPWEDELIKITSNTVKGYIENIDLLTMLGVDREKKSPKDAARARAIMRKLGWQEMRKRLSDGSNPRRWYPPPENG